MASRGRFTLSLSAAALLAAWGPAALAGPQRAGEGGYGFSVEPRNWVVYAQNAPIGMAAEPAVSSFEALAFHRWGHRSKMKRDSHVLEDRRLWCAATLSLLSRPWSR